MTGVEAHPINVRKMSNTERKVKVFIIRLPPRVKFDSKFSKNPDKINYIIYRHVRE